MMSKRWQDTQVTGQSTIRETIEVIERGGFQIALVTDDGGRLLGTVTDGDIRRGLLRGLTLDAEVTAVMNPKPLTFPPKTSRGSMLRQMRERGIRQVPVVEADGKVSRLECLDEVRADSTAEKPNWVVLLAGGLGTRLWPLTEETPKPLLPVGDRPILEIILRNFAQYGFKRFYCSVNYKAELFQSHFGDGSRFGVEMRYLVETERLGTAGPLALIPELPKLDDEPLIAMNGDLLTQINFQQLLDFHADHAADATMCVREYDFQVPYGVVRMDPDRSEAIQGIDEKPVERFFVNAGIYALNRSAVARVPKGKRYDMPQLFQELIREGKKVVAFPIREYWLDIGRPPDFERAQSDALAMSRLRSR